MTETQSTVRAALWMGGSIASFVTMTVAGRAIMPELDVFQVMEMRSVIGWFILLPMVFAAGGFAAMRTRRPLQHIGRNVAHYAGQFLWLHALTMIPLAELISIEFTTPVWGALLAVLFLGERMSLRKAAAILFGLVGVFIIVRPGVTEADPGHLIMLAGAVGFGIALVMVKSLTRTDSVVAIIFWMLIIQSVIGLVPAIAVWQAPEPWMWPWIFVIAFTGMSSHFCMAGALSHAETMVVMPMDFLRLPFFALTGFLLYNERIDLYTAIGAALILAGNLFNIQRRAREPEIATS
ncbi:DMT family transporter [Mesorhizobium sp. YM1C-6-2]|uniref:DMT family transporter n=1 Tax=Mesorhizobium sp. YM1C-6-2 TaxID=1827501 RepID=UPI000EF1C3D6|nr:DMT family transporter [Mesorhizobium sp. YM1C-6-2]RLP23379.1 DMT family transporter [Mesorhizobium sp. YM1C-6-2]